MPVTDPAALARQYHDDADLSARQRIYRFAAPGAPPWHAWVFDHLLAHAAAPEVAGRARVLEVGCGNATLWRENLPRVPAEWHVLLGDRSQGMLDAARRGIAGDGRFDVLRLDVQSIPLPHASCDVVVANHMLYHVPDLGCATGEIRRALRPGGVLLAATNGERHMRQVKELLARFAPLGEVSRTLSGAFGSFSLESGGPQLRRHFRHVTLHRIDGDLRVTDPQAVVDYVLSIDGAADAKTGAVIAHLRKTVEDEIARTGAFRIETSAGLFVAT